MQLIKRFFRRLYVCPACNKAAGSNKVCEQCQGLNSDLRYFSH
jgi:hypothetical protein